MTADPFRYFRPEARELADGLTNGLLALERGDGDVREHLARLMRHAHTLKGAARVVRLPELADTAHEFENKLSPFRDAGQRPSSDDISQLLQLVDAVNVKLAALDAAAGETVTVGSSAAQESRAVAEGGAPEVEAPPLRIESTRVHLADLDRVLDALFEAEVRLGHLRDLLRPLGPVRQMLSRLASAGGTGFSVKARRELLEARHSLEALTVELTGGLDAASGEIAYVRSRAARLRLLPAASLLAPLERVARDAAASLGRRVEMRLQGGDIELDAHVMAGMRDALIHVVRNAVDHGIEPPDERRAKGKAETGQLRIVAERMGEHVRFSVEDDGAGVDVAALRRSAVKAGREVSDTDEEVLFDYIFEPGVSTRSQVSELSGRGVGLDVVRQTAARFHGEAALATSPGKGTTVSVTVPVSLAIVSGLLVSSGGYTVALPLDAVRRSHLVSPDTLLGTRERGLVSLEGRTVPVVSLTLLLGVEQESETLAESGSSDVGALSASDARRPFTVLLLGNEAQPFALAVDRVVGVRPLTLRRTPARLEALPVAGVAFDPEGTPLPLLEPAELGARAELPSIPAKRETRQRPRVLVIDDSTTTRMLEKTILESAGYQVDTASSGEEALRMARSRKYGLFVVDIDMPEMNGFEFVERTRLDPDLKEVPSLIVSARDSDEDRRRGLAVGARGYIVKSRFVQDEMLELVRGLIG